MFEGFARHDVDVGDVRIHAVIGGSGPPLLLLHGFPQTHAMWHGVASPLAERFTVVGADLRGYGDSSKPSGGPDHSVYAKRAMAWDMVRLMAHFGFDRFQLAGHDRGGRVAHRLALDHGERVERLCLLDIVPTATLFAATNKALATGYYHWFFLIQPQPLPETLIERSAIAYLHAKLAGWGTGLDAYSPAALAEYERCIQDPATIHAMCEDYRAAASIDLVHDAADAATARIICPLLVLWGDKGLMHRHFDVLETWRVKHADPSSVTGQALPCGHFMPEENPAAVLAAFKAFFVAHP
ncbi:MAG: alpha/beta hydrolase [Geminicoccaceae bacterium]|nr:MAG: alpha/beta hydrolase [Geminicoccaceae bacterium]